MSVLQSNISARDERFKANAAAMGRLTAELRERLATASSLVALVSRQLDVRALVNELFCCSRRVLPVDLMTLSVAE